MDARHRWDADHRFSTLLVPCVSEPSRIADDPLFRPSAEMMVLEAVDRLAQKGSSLRGRRPLRPRDKRRGDAGFDERDRFRRRLRVALSPARHRSAFVRVRDPFARRRPRRGVLERKRLPAIHGDRLPTGDRGNPQTRSGSLRAVGCSGPLKRQLGSVRRERQRSDGHRCLAAEVGLGHERPLEIALLVLQPDLEAAAPIGDERELGVCREAAGSNSFLVLLRKASAEPRRARLRTGRNRSPRR